MASKLGPMYEHPPRGGWVLWYFLLAVILLGIGSFIAFATGVVAIVHSK